MGTIATAAVLGAGTMGAQIAAHMANAGLAVTLFDLTSDLAAAGLGRLRTVRPPPLFVPELGHQIRHAGLDQLPLLATADWVVEAIVESLEAKRDLIAAIEPHLAPHAIVSSNTSAIPLAEIVAGRAEALRRRWVGTHFFNPPRYLRLVELIPTADTAPGVVDAITRLLEVRLGKGVVIAHDTPGFIANRLGVFGALRAIEAWATGELTMEEIDLLTGPAIGRPKSATFRTLDLAGLDVFASVTADLGSRLPPVDGMGYSVPPVLQQMLDRGWLGEKTGQGFYKRASSSPGSPILALDPSTLEYRPLQPARLAAIETAEREKTAGGRLKRLFLGDDAAGRLLRQVLGTTLMYAARVQPEIAGSIDDVDRAMRWGFGWSLGPFETWDAIGVGEVTAAMDASAPPPLVAGVLARGSNAFRVDPLPPAGSDLLLLTSSRTRPGAIVRTSEGASLVDLGDGVFCVELHSKMNVLGGDALAMLRAGIAHVAAAGVALLVGSEGEHFSAGADLRLVLFEAQDANWPAIDALVREFQATMMAIKNAPVPVIAVTAGLALGGGCEVCLHADRVQAAAETYIGLAEAGVGLIPAGGGTKEMLMRAAGLPDRDAAVRVAFETIGFARISTSAADARRLRYLRDADAVTMNRERVIADAKAAAVTRARTYRPRPPATAIPVGGADTFAALALGIHLARRAERISDHDALIGRRLAHVLAGGDLPHGSVVSEQHLLDLERDAFVSLCGEPRTIERIAYTLKTGKTLRN